jgi:hypothetical protein
MPLFDRNKRPPEFTPEIMDELNALIDRLQNVKVAQIILPEPPAGLRVPNLIRCYLQAHLRRCLIFLEAGVAELEAGRPLATELCARALYENIATICDFSDGLTPLFESSDYSAIEQHVTKAAFATRIPSFLKKYGKDAKAPQILDHIDQMKSRAPNYREAYDHLSDIVHPNGMGAVVYFAKIADGVVSFADAGNDPERARGSLLVAAVLMAHVEISYIQIEYNLRKLNQTVSAKHLSAPRT